MSDQRVAALQAYIKKMPSLPTTMTKILEICNDPKSSPADLNRVISLDPVLMGKVMRLNQLRLLRALPGDHLLGSGDHHARCKYGEEPVPKHRRSGGHKPGGRDPWPEYGQLLAAFLGGGG